MRGHWLFVLTLGVSLAACGDTQENRAASGGVGGAAMGALVGGPIGLVIGGGIGYVAGNKLDKSADEKIEEMASVPPPGAPPRPTPVSVQPAAEASGSAERPKDLTQEQVEEKLNAAGYKPVRDIRRDGAAYLARGEREGTLYAVRVDAATGRLLASQEVGTVPLDGDGTPVMSEQQVRSTLRRTGYEMVGDVERSGNRYRAEAMQSGVLYDLVVDGRTGKVVSATRSTASGAPPPRQGG